MINVLEKFNYCDFFNLKENDQLFHKNAAAPFHDPLCLSPSNVTFEIT